MAIPFADRIRIINLKMMFRAGYELEAKLRMRDYILQDKFNLGDSNGETWKQETESPRPASGGGESAAEPGTA